MLDKNHDTEETDASTTYKQDNRSPLPFHSRDTQIDIIMAEERGTNLIASGQQLDMTGAIKSTVKPYKVAPTNLKTPKNK